MKKPTPETDAVAAHEGNWDTKALRMTVHARKLERERDELREVLERIVNLSMNARRVEEDYAEWEKAVLAILELCEERKEK